MRDDLKKLYLEPTSRCNFKCSMCFRHSWFDERPGDMSAVTFANVLRCMPSSVETVFFGGMGEPLFHKNILDMVQSMAARGARVELLTNAALLDAAMSRALLKAGLAMLWISLDAFDEESYGAIRVGGELAAIKRNIQAFNDERGRMGSRAELGLNVVAMKSNARQLAHIPRFAVLHKVSKVNISHLIPSDEASEKQILYDRVMDGGTGLAPRASAPTINIPLMNWRQEEVADGLNGLLASSACNLVLSGQPLARSVNRCRFIEEGIAFVRHDGQVSPCMSLLHSAYIYINRKKRVIYHHSFGNAGELSLEAIWHGNEYSEFRKKVREFDFSPCTRCGGCELSEKNRQDCFGNTSPTCGACLWAEGLVSCP